MLVVNNSVPAKTLPELIAYLKANPHNTFGSAGTGTSQQLSAELFKQLTGTRMTHVPYKGGGEITLSFNNMKATLEKPEITAKILAVGGVPAPMTRPEFSLFMIAERAKWKDIVAAAAIKAN